MSETIQMNEKSGSGSSGFLRPNTILQRRYKIIGQIGGGGMGTVYKSRDLRFEDVSRLAAVKEMHTPSNNPALREQTLATFRREANILAALSHPAIPRIYDFFDQNERAYLVMEFINGNDIEALLNKTRNLPVEKVIDWAIDLCGVLSYLHGREPEPIVFRDIKPSNIMVDSLGEVRLIDFGIAKMFTNTNKPHTMIGTEGYSAPEQYKGHVAPKSDQYSLGATLHQILTRKDPRLEPPFSFHERPIQDYNPDVPKWFSDIIEKALSFSPDDRFASCEEMGEAIKAKRYRRGSTLPMTGEASGFTGGMGNTIEPVWTFKTEDEIRTSPVVHDGMVYIGSYDTNIWALQLDDGNLEWKYPTQGGIASSPVVDPSNGLIYFGSEDHSFNAVESRTGRIMWAVTTQGRNRGTATIAMDHVFFGSDDGRLYALQSTNGRKMWTFDANSEIRTRPFVTDELVIFGTDMGEVIALSLAGEIKWRHKSKAAIYSSPIVDTEENILYVGSNDKHLYALDASSGYSSWRFRTRGPVISTPVIHKRLIIFGSADNNVYAVEASSGREKWHFSTEKPFVSSPVIHKDRVYIGGTDSYLYCLDVKTGKEQWKFKAEAEIVSTPYVNDEYIIFGSMDHQIYALPILE